MLMSDSFLIFHRFLNNNGLGKVPLKSLLMSCLCCAIQQLLLSFTKFLSVFINIPPVITSRSLLACIVIPMCHFVHHLIFSILLKMAAFRVQQLFSRDLALWRNSKSKLAFIAFLRQYMASLDWSTKRLIFTRCINLLPNLVMKLSETLQILWLNYSINMLWAECFLSKCSVGIVINILHSRVNLTFKGRWWY